MFPTAGDQEVDEHRDPREPQLRSRSQLVQPIADRPEQELLDQQRHAHLLHEEPQHADQHHRVGVLHGGASVDASIYQSPRFCLVPVSQQKPAQGGSSNYWIVDVRACFITSESNTSTWNNQVFDTSQGRLRQRHHPRQQRQPIETLDVVFFNNDTLPTTAPTSATTSGWARRPCRWCSSRPPRAHSRTRSPSPPQGAGSCRRRRRHRGRPWVHDLTTPGGHRPPASPSARTASASPPGTWSSRAWSSSTATGAATPVRSTWSCATATCWSSAR